MRSLAEKIVLPVSGETAFRVISDLNTLLRLSPFFTLKKIESSKEGVAQKEGLFKITIEYYEKNISETYPVEVEAYEVNRRISYSIGDGMVKNVIYEINDDETGIQLTQTFLLASEDEAAVKSARNELHFWLRSVGEYVKLAEGKTLFKKAQKSFMDRIWLRLTLSERNIAIIMVKISVLEIVLLLVIVLIWNIGMRS